MCRASRFEEGQSLRAAGGGAGGTWAVSSGQSARARVAAGASDSCSCRCCRCRDRECAASAPHLRGSSGSPWHWCSGGRSPAGSRCGRRRGQSRCGLQAGRQRGSRRAKDGEVAGRRAGGRLRQAIATGSGGRRQAVAGSWGSRLTILQRLIIVLLHFGEWVPGGLLLQAPDVGRAAHVSGRGSSTGLAGAWQATASCPALPCPARLAPVGTRHHRLTTGMGATAEEAACTPPVEVPRLK